MMMTITPKGSDLNVIECVCVFVCVCVWMCVHVFVCVCVCAYVPPRRGHKHAEIMLHLAENPELSRIPSPTPWTGQIIAFRVSPTASSSASLISVLPVHLISFSPVCFQHEEWCVPWTAESDLLVIGYIVPSWFVLRGKYFRRFECACEWNFHTFFFFFFFFFFNMKRLPLF